MSTVLLRGTRDGPMPNSLQHVWTHVSKPDDGEAVLLHNRISSSSVHVTTSFYRNMDGLLIPAVRYSCLVQSCVCASCLRVAPGWSAAHGGGMSMTGLPVTLSLSLSLSHAHTHTHTHTHTHRVWTTLSANCCVFTINQTRIQHQQKSQVPICRTTGPTVPHPRKAALLSICVVLSNLRVFVHQCFRNKNECTQIIQWRVVFPSGLSSVWTGKLFRIQRTDMRAAIYRAP